MRFVTFTVRRGLSAADKTHLSEAMLEAEVAAGYHRADRLPRHSGNNFRFRYLGSKIRNA
jgi:hypothetical protein